MLDLITLLADIRDKQARAIQINTESIKRAKNALKALKR